MLNTEHLGTVEPFIVMCQYVDVFGHVSAVCGT